MARRAQENPALDMTPMIDVVFELIIFFVVTLTQCNAKDETIRLEDGRYGIELTPDEMPASRAIWALTSISSPKILTDEAPSKMIRPPSGFSIPAIILARVDFPPPFGPVMTVRDPSGTVSDTSRTISLSMPSSSTINDMFFNSIMTLSFCLSCLQA